MAPKGKGISLFIKLELHQPKGTHNRKGKCCSHGKYSENHCSWSLGAFPPIRRDIRQIAAGEIKENDPQRQSAQSNRER